MTQIYAELSVTSKNENLQELSIITGLYSSGGHNVNEISRTGKIFDYSQWNYTTDVIETCYSEEVSPFLIKAFEKGFNEFSEFVDRKKCKVSICFVVNKITEIIPDLTIDSEMINFAAKLNAKIYFDGLGQLAAYLPANSKGNAGVPGCDTKARERRI